MKTSSISLYRCPADKSALQMEKPDAAGTHIDHADLVSAAGRRFPVVRGIPYLLYPEVLSAIEAKTKSEYDRVAEAIYDVAVDWQFAAFREDEGKVRESLVDLLGVHEGDRVLEVGCGTGRDSFRIARRLGRDGALFMQDLSPGMVHACESNMLRMQQEMDFSCAMEFSVSNANYLPFPDGYFDAVFHFGGFNEFGNLAQAAAELTRVTRLGGRVLIGDESVGPWLRGSEFEGIVTTNNKLFKAELPLATLPICARDVTVKWMVGNCFYAMAFTKGDGPPDLDLDLQHQGTRGGSLRTRYFGVLEGVTPEAKALARQAAAAAGMSEHAWLDGLVKRAAAEVMKK